MDWYQLAIDRLNWVEITLWYLRGEHNHIERGHSDKSQPVGHTSWVNGKWSKRFVYAEKGSKPLKILD